MTDKPEPGSVEDYVQMLREADTKGAYLYAYAYGFVAQLVGDTFYTAEERVRRIGNLDTALRTVRAEQRAADCPARPGSEA